MKLMRNYVKRKEIDETMEQYEQHNTTQRNAQQNIRSGVL